MKELLHYIHITLLLLDMLLHQLSNTLTLVTQPDLINNQTSEIDYIIRNNVIRNSKDALGINQRHNPYDWNFIHIFI